jgi:hypothetical protein
MRLDDRAAWTKMSMCCFRGPNTEDTLSESVIELSPEVMS